jgi:hypothetical protein
MRPIAPRSLHPAACLWLAPALLIAGPVLAQDAHSSALDRVEVSLGGYYANVDTRIGASSTAMDQAMTFGLEDDLGFPAHETVPRVRLDVLGGNHQGVSLDFYSLNRSHERSLSQAISYRGTTYEASASVRGKLDFDFGSAAWRWWFGEGSDVFGVGLGAAYYQVNASISGQATVNDITESAASSTRDNAWAPMLQLGWRHAFNDQWRVYLDASGVKKNGGRLNGHIYNAALGVTWYPWENLGFGAEYGYSRIMLNQHKSRYNARLDMKLDGPSLFVKLRF